MKTFAIVLVVVALLVSATLLLRLHSHGARNVQLPPPGSKPTKYSDGGSDWYLGTFNTNGTNVAPTNITVRALPSPGVSRETNGISK